MKKVWEEVGKGSSDGKVELKDQLLRVGSDLAYEVGVEKAEFTLGGERVGGEIRVTNVYQKEGGTWKITHHHTDVVPAMVEILHRMGPPSGKA